MTRVLSQGGKREDPGNEVAEMGRMEKQPMPHGVVANQEVLQATGIRKAAVHGTPSLLVPGRKMDY